MFSSKKECWVILILAGALTAVSTDVVDVCVVGGRLVPENTDHCFVAEVARGGLWACWSWSGNHIQPPMDQCASTTQLDYDTCTVLPDTLTIKGSCFRKTSVKGAGLAERNEAKAVCEASGGFLMAPMTPGLMVEIAMKFLISRTGIFQQPNNHGHLGLEQDPAATQKDAGWFFLNALGLWVRDDDYPLPWENGSPDNGNQADELAAGGEDFAILLSDGSIGDVNLAKTSLTICEYPKVTVQVLCKVHTTTTSTTTSSTSTSTTTTTVGVTRCQGFSVGNGTVQFSEKPLPGGGYPKDTKAWVECCEDCVAVDENEHVCGTGDMWYPPTTEKCHPKENSRLEFFSIYERRNTKANGQLKAGFPDVHSAQACKLHCQEDPLCDYAIFTPKKYQCNIYQGKCEIKDATYDKNTDLIRKVRLTRRK